MNEILHFFDFHLTTYSDFVHLNRQKNKATKNARRAKKLNNLYRDILRGLKRNELMLFHKNVKRIEKIVDAFVVLENVFVPFF
jgi:hypothetical protein